MLILNIRVKLNERWINLDDVYGRESITKRMMFVFFFKQKTAYEITR